MTLTQYTYKKYEGIHPAVAVDCDSILSKLDIPKGVSRQSMEGWLKITLQSLFERGRLDMWDRQGDSGA